ncbi:MAG: hypothetical protein WD557_01385 [Dehalococcoidia bacterium]
MNTLIKPGIHIEVAHYCGHTEGIETFGTASRVAERVAIEEGRKCPPCYREAQPKGLLAAPGSNPTDAELYAAYAERQRIPEHAHIRRPVPWLMINCPPCGTSKVRWMLTEPEHSHAGRSGRRLARIWSIDSPSLAPTTTGGAAQ